MDELVRRIAATQLSLLVRDDVLSQRLQQQEIPEAGTPIHDVNGEVLYERVALTGAYVDLAVDRRMGAPLVALTYGDWDAAAVVEQTARSLGQRAWDDARIVAYSHPRLAVQYLLDGREVAMVEIGTGALIGDVTAEPDATPPRELSRWSYLETLPKREAARRARRYMTAVASAREFDLRPVILADLPCLAELAARTDSRELHYSRRNADHTCFELRGQQTGLWCVGASVQMVLDFYRYEYTQDRLATELGLGTRTNPNGLPYAQDGEVVVVLENLSGKALTANMNTTPTFAEMRSEILANRPLISFVPRHSRAVAGYTRTRSKVSPALNFNGILVYDPWPLDTGAIVRWENFDATTYRRTFTSRVTLV